MEDYRQEHYYVINEASYMRYAKRWLREQPGWKKISAVSGTLYITALLSVVGLPWLVFGSALLEDISFTTVGAGLGFLTGAIFFCMGRIVYNFGKRKCGGRILRMRKPFLFTNYSGIQFGYHDSMDRNPEGMVVYQIAYANISHVSVNSKMRLLSVYGSKEVVEYDSLTENRIRQSFTQGQFGDNAVFHFFLCFEDEEKFFENLKDQNVTVISI